MKDKSKYYKDVIKTRMYKSASGIWDVRNIDNFDPLVKMLIEALASEINKLSNELENVEARILERIACVLTPDVLMSVRPAHMILHAMPTEDSGSVCKTSGFYYKSKEYGNLGFYPAGDFELTGAEVRSVVGARKMYLIDGDKNRKLFLKGERSAKFSDKLWLGLYVPPTIRELQNVSFYFDLPNIDKKHELLHLLPYSVWEHEGTTLTIRPGINIKKNSRNDSPLAAHDLTNLYNAGIINSYDHHFVTIDELVCKKENMKPLPDELTELFSSEERNDSPEPLLWLKINLPPGFDDYILDDFFVSLNAFPVINRKFYSKIYKTNPVISVMPFETEENEYFLSVDSVIDSKSRKYMYLPFGDENGKKYGTYTVKLGGAERFDSRNAREYLSNFVDIMREENTSFVMFGKGFVDELVKRIETDLNAAELKLREVNLKRDISTYMIIDSNDVGDSVYLDYWVTNCETANGIKQGNALLPSADVFVNRDSIIALTQSEGGRRRQSSSLDMYKYVLTSRDRIYTGEDIINFCFSHFGDIIVSATVKKGVCISPRPKEGLIRSIDVYVTLNGQIVPTPEMEDRLLSLLKRQSPDIYNYRVFISNNKQ